MKEPLLNARERAESFDSLTDAERAAAYRIVADILLTPGYGLAARWIEAAPLVRARSRWKTCTIAHVVEAMHASSGHLVSIEQMALALANAGFVAREIDGEPSTNVKLRYLPKAGARVSLH